MYKSLNLSKKKKSTNLSFLGPPNPAYNYLKFENLIPKVAYPKLH